jgi:hypothetical protein
MTQAQLQAPGKHAKLPVLTERRDAWWLTPAVTFGVLSTFIVYATWAAMQGKNYTYGPYLSPFYSPEIFGDSPHAWFGPKPSWWPAFLPFSPAILILWAPGGFRVTCYYYRGAYYKAFWADPPACGVAEPRKSYWGERSFPLIIQNIHRYFMYLAVAFIFMLSWDVVKATRFDDGQGGHVFGIGVGTLVLAANTTLLAGYTFGCHSLRHLIGGGRDSIGGGAARSCYECVSGLNRRHQLFAWSSLVMVMLADLYVRLCALNVIHDWRIL